MSHLHDQNIQEQKGIISFNFHCELDGRSDAVEMKKLLQSCWSMWPNHKSVVDVSEPLSGFVVCGIKCYLLTSGDGEFPNAMPFFADRIFPQTGST
jgi:hypothetical protein